MARQDEVGYLAVICSPTTKTNKWDLPNKFDLRDSLAVKL